MSSAPEVVDHEGNAVVTTAPYKVVPFNRGVIEEVSDTSTAGKKVSGFENVYRALFSCKLRVHRVFLKQCICN